MLFLVALIGTVWAQEPGKLFLQGNSLSTLCTGGNSQRQLGYCSPYFLECANSEFRLRKCPFKTHVFANGICQEARGLRNCQDSKIARLDEETAELVKQLQYCNNGGFGVFYTSAQGSCSRQAFICHHNQHDVIAVSCPEGSVIQQDLSCGTAAAQFSCYGPDQTTPIRQHFLNQICSQRNSYKKKSGYGVDETGTDTVTQTCTAWYISCNPPSIIHCGAGEVFANGQCRRWTGTDACVGAGVCSGHEYQKIPIGECEAKFINCNSASGSLSVCGYGTVFHNGQCVSPTQAGCAECVVGEMKPTANCNIIMWCQIDPSTNRPRWIQAQCPPGTTYSSAHNGCIQGQTCATTQPTCQQGSTIPISCSRYMYCDGDRYVEYICPAGTSIDHNSGYCIPSTSCGQQQTCVEGNVLPTQDCHKYQVCQGGKWVTYSCTKSSGNCPSCNSNNAPNHLSYPANCEEKQRRPHDEDCEAYYECQRGQWNYHRCQQGYSFDATTNKCVLSDPYRRCGTSPQVQCPEGQVIVSNEDCNKLVQCLQGRYVQAACPQGTYYDIERRGCAPGQCQQGGVVPPPGPPAPPPVEPGMPPSSSPEDPLDYGSITQMCSGNEVLPDQYDCKRYWACTRHNVYVSKMCPRGSSFNPQKRACEKGAQCGRAECADGSFQPQPTCGEYKVCVRGKFVNGLCSNNKKFFNGRCIEEKCPQSVPEYECNAGAVRPYPNGNEPNRYLFCYYGKWVERSCGADEIFDWKNLQCVRQQTPGPDPYHLTCYNGATKEVSCDTFERCEYGEWVSFRCPYGTRFAGGRCVEGDCHGSGHGKCLDGSYKRARHDCTKFYQCVHGAWTEMPCAPGTVFNERKQVCDWARDVPECMI